MMAPCHGATLGGMGCAQAVCKAAPVNGTHCGFNNVARNGANYHAWENDVHIAFGLLYWGLQDRLFARPIARVDASPVTNLTLLQLGNAIVRQQLSAPVVGAGAFPSVYEKLFIYLATFRRMPTANAEG